MTDRSPNIPPKSNRRWKPCFSKRLYRERNLIKRFFSKLKHFRRVATRYDKLATNFLAMVQLASIRLWLRAYESTAWPPVPTRATRIGRWFHRDCSRSIVCPRDARHPRDQPPQYVAPALRSARWFGWLEPGMTVSLTVRCCAWIHQLLQPSRH